MSTLSYSISGSYFESAAPEKADLRFDMVIFLGVAQIFGIDFLPVAWQPALDRIGEGATAEIRENFMDLQTSFAFKRPIFRFTYNLDEFESRVLPSIIAEICALGIPSIRNHPNIMHLEGICWEICFQEGQNVTRKKPISDSRGGIVPVLIFEKTNHGDLHRFMTHRAEKPLAFTERLEICADIAKAIAEMHSHSKLRSAFL